MSFLHTFQSQNCQVRDSGLHPVSIILCSYSIHRAVERTLPPSSHSLQVSSVRLSVPPAADREAAPQGALSWAGLLPSAGSCIKKENGWCGGLQAPKLVPKGLYFRPAVWFKCVLNGSDQCLKWKQEEVRDVRGSYTTADQGNRGSTFAWNKTKEKQLPVLEMPHITKPSQSMVLWVAAGFKR